MPYTKINLKWTKALHLGGKTIKLYEESIDVNLQDFGLGNGFLNMMPKTQGTKVKNR